jgi:UDP-N-acetylmuramoyl-tripeptide--D-alanyl-D-alanine ligase
MGTIERIARAKSELVAALPPNGLAVLNGDDPWTTAMAETSGIARFVLVGRGESCDYRAEEIKAHGLEGTSFRIVAEGRRISLRTRVPGVHTVPAFLAAIAVARELGMNWADIEQAAGHVTLEARQRVVGWRDPAFGSSVLLIDDSYNASPLSMNAALDLLQAAPGTKIAVLGDMLELGPDEEAAHRDIGRRAAQVVDWLVIRGPRAEWLADAALAAGLAETRLYRAASNGEAAQRVREIMASAVPVGAAHDARTIQRIGTPGRPEAVWSVLVKGSRGIRMEEVVRALRGKE